MSLWQQQQQHNPQNLVVVLGSGAKWRTCESLINAHHNPRCVRVPIKLGMPTVTALTAPCCPKCLHSTYDIMWREALMELLDQLEAENPENPALAPKVCLVLMQHGSTAA